MARLVWYQIVLVTVLSGVSLLVVPKWSLAWVCGLLCYSLPHTYFTIYMLRCQKQPIDQVVRGSYRGMLGKYLLTLAAFALVFAYPVPQPVAVLAIGYVLAAGLNLCLTAYTLRSCR